MDFSSLSFPNAPFIKVSPPGPRSQELLQHQQAHEASAVSYPRGLPMAVNDAKGATVADVDGNVYVDFFGGAGVMAVGHSNPQVTSAVIEQVGQVTHTLDIPTPARQRLVDRLLSILPQALNRLLFGGPTGSDAVEAAVKLAKFNTGRHPMIAFEGGYHGMTAGALSLTSARAFKHRIGPLLPEVHFTPYAYCYRCAFKKTPDTCSLECAEYLEHRLDDPHSGVNSPAAVIIEPIQGEGGSIVPPPRFLTRVRQICDKYEVLLIADEIQSGFCRTGRMFAFEHSGVIPDVVTLSKALGGGGFPLAAIAYRERLNTMPPALHIGTFRGNMAAYAAGAAAIDFMQANRLAEHAAAIGQDMLSTLAGLEGSSTIVGEVRGKGLMLGVEFVHDRATKQPAPELAAQIRTLCHRRGLLIEIGGHYSNVARFLPPLVLTRELAMKGTEIFMDCVKDVEATRQAPEGARTPSRESGEPP
jgi:diaminobutyrate-2-oxoglutarate transaminase